eukprot:TRINITY_DN39472_c0_g1_i1.p1 TRINITY_DN39472_c0_g1~~TRINITY_DN39472_c0_g1_i1.p1  ORF type:complete len:358 (+),score=91.77 TRINITY_DN39472_c0_g1_i1:57-1076(+)
MPPGPRTAAAVRAALALLPACAAAQCNVNSFTAVRTTVTNCRAQAAGNTQLSNQCSCTHVTLYDRECTTNNCRTNAQVGAECVQYESQRAALQQQCQQASGVVVGSAGPMPCLVEKETCRKSMMVVNQYGVLVESLEWQQAIQQEQWETSRCNNANANCWSGKANDCTRYEECTPAAAQCITSAAVAAYGAFRTAECQAFVTCRKDNVDTACLSAYGGQMVSTNAQGTSIACDSAAICKRAKDQATADVRCSMRSVLDCETDSDCTWHQKSMRCWDKPSDRETIELVLICLAAAIIVFIIVITAAYMLLANQRAKTAGFESQPVVDDREMLAMDPHGPR